MAGMTRDEAVAEIQEGLGFRADQATAIIRRLQRVQFLLEQGRTLPWFLEKSTTVAVLANSDMLVTSLPGFIREIRNPQRGMGVYYLDSNNAPVFLQKLDPPENWQSLGVGLSTDTVVAYSLTATSLQLFPRTHVAVSLTVDYFGHDAVLTSNVTNLWLTNAPYLMIGNAGASFAQTIQNTAAYNEFTQLAQVSWQSIFAETIEREIANRQYVVGRNS